MTLGVSIKLLHEAVGHTITVETNTGETFRGALWNCEDTANCHMRDCLRIAQPTVC